MKHSGCQIRGVWLGMEEEGQRCQWKLSPGEARRAEEPSRGSSIPFSARHCLTPRSYLLWRRHRAGPRFPPGALAGGRPAPRLLLHGVALAAFISEAEQNQGQGAVEKPATGSSCLQPACSEPSIPLPQRPGPPKKARSQRSHFAASRSCYCLLTATEGPWRISSMLEG